MNHIAETRALKCLHIAENVDLEKGGVARALIDLVSGLQRNGVSTVLASSDIEQNRSSIPASPIGPELRALPNDSHYLDHARVLIRQADILHLHTPWWLMNPPLVRAARDFGKPVVLSIHGMLDDWSLSQKRLKKWCYLQLVAAGMIRCCFIHCTAEDELRQVLKRVVPLGAEVLPLVVDPHYFDLRLDLETAPLRWPFLKNLSYKKLLFLSRIHPKKSLEVAIHAMPALQDCMLAIAGPGDTDYVDSLKQLAAKLGVASRVHWLGSVHGREKDSLLACCDCMLLPTQQENFGLVQVEGLAIGMNVITTYGTDNWRELKECGAIIVERTPAAFVGAVNRCKTDSIERENRLAFQRARLLEWLEPDRTSQRYVAMYEKCLQLNGGAPAAHSVNDKTRVLHTVAGLSIYGGGPSVSVPAICQHLQQKRTDWRISILTTAGNAKRPSIDLKDMDVVKLPAGQLAWTAYRRAKQQILELAPKLIHDHGQWLPVNHASTIAARELGIPRIVSPRGMLSPWSRNHHRWKKQMAWWLYAHRDLNSATVLHATSELELHELRELGCRHPIALIPNGVFVTEDRIYEKAKPPYVLFLSRLHPKKGLKELLSAWSQVNPAGWELKVAGPDPLNLVKKYNIENRANVRYLGMVRGESKDKLLREASLYVLPSYSENFGITVAEALMARTPVITTHGTPWKIVADMHCGWWIEMSVASLAKHLELATQLPSETLQAFGEKGRQVVVENFSWPKIASEMSQVYQWMLHGGPVPKCVKQVDAG